MPACARLQRLCHRSCPGTGLLRAWRQALALLWAGAVAGPLALGLSGTAAAAEALNSAAALPQGFAVRDLSIELSRQDGNAAHKPWQVRLSGAGRGSLSHDGRRWQLTTAPRDVVTVLNRLLELHFFDMPASTSSSAFAQLQDDGSVRLIERSQTSANGNSLCVRIASFERCVRFGPSAPVELSQLFERVIAETQRRAGLEPTK